MKKFIKNNLLGFILGAIIFSTITAYATARIQADDIIYKNTTVDSALNELYNKSINSNKICKFIDGTYGSKGNVGAKYECNLGDGIRYFYILTVNNSNTVELIMDSNLKSNNEEIAVNRNDALDYFNNGAGKDIVWKNVADIGITSASRIIQIINFNNFNGISAFCLEGNSQYIQWDSNPHCPNSTNNYKWLSGGHYWLSDQQSSDWYWAMNADSSVSGEKDYNVIGIRPVITILKSNLYE